MTPRIITADEAKALLDGAKLPSLETAIGRVFGDFASIEHFVRIPEEDFSIAADVCGPDAMPSEGAARLLAAAPDLAATVVAQAAEIDRLRAIIDGRTTPPTDAEIRDAARAGLTVILHAIDSRTGRIVDLRTRDVPLVSVWATHHAEGHFASVVWRLVDANDRPREWSVPSEPR